MTNVRFFFGAFELDTATREIRRDSKLLDVEPRVFRFIEYLVRERDRIVSKGELDREIWRGRSVSPASTSVCAASARRVLGDNTSRQKFIRTYYGRGYRFVGRVTETSINPSDGDRQLVGRTSEIDAFLRRFDNPAVNFSGIVMVHGEPGAGKSSLVHELSRIASGRKITTSLAECPEYDGSAMQSPWAQILARIDQDSDESEIPDLALLGLPGPKPHTGMSGDLNIAKRRFFEAVSKILREAATQQPLLLVFDDIHRADALSLELIRFVSIDLSSRDLLLLCTYRSSEPISNQAFGQSLSSINGLANVDQVHLGGLDIDAIAVLANQSLGRSVTRKTAERLHSVTNGNPLYLHSVLSLAGRSHVDFAGICQSSDNRNVILPHDLSATIVAHLSTLPQETLAVLEDASVIGRRFSIDTLASVSSAAGEDLERALSEAVDRGFVRKLSRFPVKYEFSHIIVRDAVYSSQKESKRLDTHRRVALALSDLTTVDIGALAYHRYESGDRSSFGILRSAAKSAASRFDYSEAAGFMKRAIEVSDSNAPAERVQLGCLLELGSYQIRSASRSEAIRTFAEAATIAKSHGAPEEFAKVALECAPDFLSIESGAVDTDLIDLVREADSALKGDSTLKNLVAARLLLAIAWSPQCQNEAQELRVRLEAYCSTRPDSDILVRLLPAVWVSDWSPGRMNDRLEYGTEIFESSRSDLTESNLVFLSFYMSSLLEAGEIGKYSQWIERFTAYAKRIRQPQALWYSHMFRSLKSLLRGDFDRAESDQRELATAAQLAEDKNGLISACLHKALLDWERRRFDEGIAALEVARSACPDIKGWKIAEGPLEIDRGRADIAIKTFERFEREGFSNYGKLIDWVHMFTVGFSEMCAALCFSRPATEIYGLLLKLKGREAISGVGVMALGSTDRYLGLLAMASNNFESAKVHFKESIRFDESIGANPWVVHAKYDLARCFFRDGANGEASSLARAVVNEAKSMGMDNVAFKAERLLRKAARQRLAVCESAEDALA